MRIKFESKYLTKINFYGASQQVSSPDSEEIACHAVHDGLCSGACSAASKRASFAYARERLANIAAYREIRTHIRKVAEELRTGAAEQCVV